VIQAYLKEQDDSLAEVADTDDDEIPMRSLTPDARVNPVYPLLAKESVQELTQTKGFNSPPPNPMRAITSSAGSPINKITEKDDIFEIYKKLNNKP
jgi:hypothetical protein